MRFITVYIMESITISHRKTILSSRRGCETIAAWLYIQAPKAPGYVIYWVENIQLVNQDTSIPLINGDKFTKNSLETGKHTHISLLDY